MQTIKLYLSYFLLLVMLAMGGFGLAGYFETKRLDLALDEANRRHKELAEANLAQQDAIRELGELRARDEIALTGLSDAISVADNNYRGVRQKIDVLERTNAEIAALLDTVLPADGCVLDDSCGANRGDPGETTGTPAAALRGPRPGTGTDRP